MKQDIPYLKVASAIVVSLILFLLTDFTFILGFLLVPFVIYLLLDIKFKSDRTFFITVFIIWIPTLYGFSILSFVMFIVIVCSVLLLEGTLKQRFTQEVTLTYLTFLMGILSLSSVLILQAFKVIPSFGNIESRMIAWYTEQLNDVSSITGQTFDTEMIIQSVKGFFTLIPSQFFVVSFVIALYTVLMIRVLVTDKTQLWTYVPFSKWVFPRNIAYIYFGFMILTLFQNTLSDAVYAIVMNSMVILEWIIYIHGLAFVLYFLKHKELNTVWIVLIMIVSVILKPITLFVGFIDMLFRFRQRIETGGK